MMAYNLGYLDIPNCNQYPAWKTWLGMIKRVSQGKGRYKDVKVCEDWLYFSKFSEWYNKHKVTGWELDKDLMSKGQHNLYSPETCVYLPKEINQALQRHKGVEKADNGYIACMQRGGTVYYGEEVESEEQAREEYIQMKKDHIRFLAGLYKTLLSKEVYDTLWNYDFQ